MKQPKKFETNGGKEEHMKLNKVMEIWTFYKEVKMLENKMLVNFKHRKLHFKNVTTSTKLRKNERDGKLSSTDNLEEKYLTNLTNWIITHFKLSRWFVQHFYCLIYF